MELETAIAFAIIFAVIIAGIIVKEVQIHTEQEHFDKSNVKYTDGDNT